MKIFKSEQHSISTLIHRSLFIFSMLVFAIAILGTSYLLNNKARQDFLQQEQNVQKTLASYLIPSLSISNYLEVRRLLGYANRESSLVAVMLSDGDLILDDYERYAIFSPLMSKQVLVHNCSSINTASVKIEQKIFTVLCRDLVKFDPISSQKRGLGALITLKSVDKIYLNWKELSWMFFVLLCAVILSSIIIRSLVSKNIIKPFHVLIDELCVSKTDVLEKRPQYENNPKYPFELVELRKSYCRLLQDLYDEISQHNQTKKEAYLASLATQVAHDIRSPLSSLQAAMGYLGNITITDPKAPEVLNLLELSAKRLTGIADDLLKKHKGGDNKIIFSLHYILDELVGEYEGREEFKDLRFVKAYASRAIELYGDRAKLQRAFGNIIKNAVEAMEGRGTLALSTTKPNGKVAISIADTGPGLPPDKLNLILQGDYTEGKQDGHGIGMKVVRETITEFGGGITAESELGKGTTFVVALPLPSVAENQSVQREKTAMESFTLELVSDKEPVLVVDDEPSMREQWRLILKDHGMEAIICESYEDVVSQNIGSALTQTAIVDYHFENSERNGADVVQYLQGQGIRNITLCTAEYWKPSVQKLAQELGAKLCPKPLPKIAMSHESPVLSEVEGWVMSAEKAEVSNSKGGYRVLVIDDDDGIRLTWEMLREKLHIKVLHAFPNLEAFQKEKVDLSAIDIAFVDKNIEGSCYSGAEVIAFLKSRGAARVVLASGEDAVDLRKDPQFALADFISKEKVPQNMEAFL